MHHQDINRLVIKQTVQIWHLQVSQLFPSSLLGGSLALVMKDSLLPHFSWTTSLPFGHTFKLVHITMTLQQKWLRCVTTFTYYRLCHLPPRTSWLFFEQFLDLLEHCNSLTSLSLETSTMTVHSTPTLHVWMISFGCSACSSLWIHPLIKHRHLLDWFVHRPVDGFLQFTEVSQVILLGISVAWPTLMSPYPSLHQLMLRHATFVPFTDWT